MSLPAQNLHEFVLTLLNDEAARSAFAADPTSALAAAGLSDVTPQDIQEVAPLVADYAPAPLADALSALPLDADVTDLQGAIAQLQTVADAADALPVAAPELPLDVPARADLPTDALPTDALPVNALPVGDLPVALPELGDLPVALPELGDLPVGDLPLGDLPLDVPARADLPVDALPTDALPVNALPTDALPVNALPVGDLPVALPELGDLPVALPELGDLPVGDLPVGDLPLGDLPLDVPARADLPVGDLPVNALPVGDLPVEAPELPVAAPELGDVPVSLPEVEGLAGALPGVPVELPALGGLPSLPTISTERADVPSFDEAGDLAGSLDSDVLGRAEPAAGPIADYVSIGGDLVDSKIADGSATLGQYLTEGNSQLGDAVTGAQTGTAASDGGHQAAVLGADLPAAPGVPSVLPAEVPAGIPAPGDLPMHANADLPQSLPHLPVANPLPEVTGQLEHALSTDPVKEVMSVTDSPLTDTIGPFNHAPLPEAADLDNLHTDLPLGH